MRSIKTFKTLKVIYDTKTQLFKAHYKGVWLDSERLGHCITTPNNRAFKETHCSAIIATKKIGDNVIMLYQYGRELEKLKINMVNGIIYLYPEWLQLEFGTVNRTKKITLQR